MNVGELRKEIMNLAFEEPASMQEYADIVNTAVNRAVQEICSTVRPILGKVEIEQTEPAGREYVRYDINALGDSFMSLENKVTLEADGNYMETVPYRTEGQSVLLLPGDKTGLFTVWYKRRPVIITADTPETDELELDYDLHILVPHLSGFYVWLDDDERKATIYYNRYEELKAQILFRTTEKPMAVIQGGVRW